MRRLSWLYSFVLVLFMATGCVMPSALKLDKKSGLQEAKGPSVEELRYDLDQSNQQIEELKHSLRSLEVQIARIRASTQAHRAETSTLTSRMSQLTRSIDKVRTVFRKRDVQVILDKTSNLLTLKRYYEVVRLLKSVLPQVESQEKGHDQLLMNYAVGLFHTQAYEQATLAAADIETFHKKSDLVPKAILLQGKSLRAMGRLKEAKIFFEDLKMRFSRSKEAKLAKKELKNLKKRLKRQKKQRKKKSK